MTLVSSVTHQLWCQLLNKSPFHPSCLGIWVVIPKEEDYTKSAFEGLPDPPSEPCAGSRAMDIERLLDTDSRQASTQTESIDSASSKPR